MKHETAKRNLANTVGFGKSVFDSDEPPPPGEEPFTTFPIEDDAPPPGEEQAPMDISFGSGTDEQERAVTGVENSFCTLLENSKGSSEVINSEVSRVAKEKKETLFTKDCQELPGTDNMEVQQAEEAQENDSSDVKMEIDLYTPKEQSYSKEKADMENEAVTPEENVDNVTEEIKMDDDEATTPSEGNMPQIKSEEKDPPLSAVSETVQRIVNIICSQDVDDSPGALGTIEKSDDSVCPEVTPVNKAPVLSTEDEEARKLREEINSKIKTVQKKATELLQEWKNLQEVFKIPKRELVKLRAEHEREVDRAAAARSQISGSPAVSASASVTGTARRLIYPPPSSFTSLKDRGPPLGQVPHRPQHSYERSLRPSSPPNAQPPAAKQRERRISRFDDESGLLHQTWLSREHRRQLFMRKAEIEEVERNRRTLWQKQHENKCYFLRLDASTTPMFEEYPEFYFDIYAGQWVPMPEKYPEVEVTWGYPAMANLPLEAFKEGDPPFPDPAYFYPPGVVPVSYMYGPPPEEEYVEEGGQMLVGANVEEQVMPPPDKVHASSSAKSPPLPTHLPFLSSDPANGGGEIPFLGGNGRPTQTDLEAESQPPPPDPSAVYDNDISYDAAANEATNRPTVVVKLPPNWRFAKDMEGRVYFYNVQTMECQWEPPEESSVTGEEDRDLELLGEVEYETASVASESPKGAEEGNGADSDDEDDEEEEEEEAEEDTAKRQAEIEDLSSDLSAQEKELLLAKRKKTKEERQHERRQKRERDREKREYERKRRRERHGKHRRSGLVTEHLIPVG